MAVLLATSILIIASMVGQNQCQTFDLCRYIVPMCTNSLEAAVDDMEQGDLDDACQLLSRARSCLGVCLDRLTPGEMETVMLKVIEYACDPSRREEMLEISQAECFNDEDLAERLKPEIEQCYQPMSTGVDSAIRQAMVSGQNMDEAINTIVCPAVGNLVTCAAGKVGDRCGESVITVFEEMLKIALKEMLPGPVQSCVDQVSASHTIVKRAIDAFIRYSSKK